MRLPSVGIKLDFLDEFHFFSHSTCLSVLILSDIFGAKKKIERKNTFHVFWTIIHFFFGKLNFFPERRLEIV